MTPNAALAGRRDLGAGLALFTFLPDAPPEFEAGQHTTLALPRAGDAPLVRPFSVASPPGERAVEILARRASRRDDAFVEVLFGLAEGARVGLGPAYSGEVTIERTVGRDDPRARILVAAGTGIAPFLSIVRAFGDDGRTVVLHGARHADEFAAHETFERILGARYLRTLSGGDPAWRGFRGRVETLLDPERIDAVERGCGLSAGELTPSRAVVYVCGFRDTIVGTAARLAPRGFVPLGRAGRPSIFFEYYESEPLFPDPS